MLYCPNCGGPLIDTHGYLICTLCCASFRRTEDGKIQFFYQFSGNKHIREFMEVLKNEVCSNAKETETETETEGVSRGERISQQVDKQISQTSNDNESRSGFSTIEKGGGGSKC